MQRCLNKHLLSAAEESCQTVSMLFYFPFITFCAVAFSSCSFVSIFLISVGNFANALLFVFSPLTCPSERWVQDKAIIEQWSVVLPQSVAVRLNIVPGLWWDSVNCQQFCQCPVWLKHAEAISDRGSIDRLYLHYFLLCQMRSYSVCVWGRKILFPFASVTIILKLPPTFKWTVAQGQRKKGSLCASVVEVKPVGSAHILSHLMATLHHHAPCTEYIQRLQESRGGWRRRVCLQPRIQGETIDRELKWGAMGLFLVCLESIESVIFTVRYLVTVSILRLI